MRLGQLVARVEIEAATAALLDVPNLRLDPSYPLPVVRGMHLRRPNLQALWDM